jgi:hypothetical protein
MGSWAVEVAGAACFITSSCCDAGLGMPMAVAEVQKPKKAVPDWLRAEMLKRGINLNAGAGKLALLLCCKAGASSCCPVSLSSAAQRQGLCNVAVNAHLQNGCGCKISRML